MLESLGLSIETNYDVPVRYLSVAQQQLVEIGKALFNETNILVMDEPTSVLTGKETEILFNLINKFKEEGMAIVYISHRLEEVITISDRITILRDGELITTLDNRDKNVSKDEIVAHMIGRSIEDYYPDRSYDHINGEVVLEVNNLTAKGVFEDVSFQVRKGEIVGFAGLVGAGRTEIMKAIFGDLHFDSGEIF